MELTTRNTQIVKCGIKYIGHYNYAEIKVYGDCWGVTISQKRLREFTNIFPNKNWEDGLFLEKLAGEYIRIVYDENSNIVALKNIVKDIDYIVKDNSDEN